MTAQSLQAITLVFANPADSSDGSNAEFQKVNASLSFQYTDSSDLRTLSTNAATPGNDVTGLLYVPDLAPSDPCLHASSPYVPANVTRQADLPGGDYDLVALAPWLSPECTLAYLAAARQDPVRGFLFFLPDNGSTTPPMADSSTWGLGDGGGWKSQNEFPVYAIPGQSGQILMQASNHYSGNLTTVPNADTLSALYDSRDYVRLFVDINTGSGSSLPSLWVFLLVVLGILLALVALTSAAMHYLQLRRRNALRRRVMNGDVDLEALGVKRLTVPQELLDQMPLYTYGSSAPVALTAPTSTPVADKLASAASSRPGSPSSAARPQSALGHLSYRPSPLQQPTCAICLDDFVPASGDSQGTIVRELPCHHIFHPECVDTFLRGSSSLCPMCKKTALPKGYCPRVITNAMVRRERMMRRIRERITIDPDAGESADAGEGADQVPYTLVQRIRTRAFSGFSQIRAGRRISSAPTPSTTSQAMTEMSLSSPTPVLMRSHTTSASMSRTEPQVQPPSTAGRREWVRQRAVAMLGRREAPLDPDAEEARGRSGWRKALGGLFPGVVR